MEKKGLLLLSDGIDSPVAGHLALRAGYSIGCIHFSGCNRTVDKVLRIVKHLEELHRTCIRMYVADHKISQDRFRECCSQRFQCILCKRIMHRISERIALRDGYSSLVTGENLGQVASQTLSNMQTIHQGLKIPVRQPLLARDKTETIAIAREIGTYEMSIKDAYKCPYVPGSPATKSRPDIIRKEEEKAGMDDLIAEVVRTAKVFN